MNGADIDNNDLRTKSERRARSLIKAVADATHFFETKKAETITVIKKRCTELRKLQNDEGWEYFYETQAASLEPKPYPSLEAVRNVFALALKRDPEIAEFNPLALWDLHYLREIDDSGVYQPPIRVMGRCWLCRACRQLCRFPAKNLILRAEGKS